MPDPVIPVVELILKRIIRVHLTDYVQEHFPSNNSYIGGSAGGGGLGDRPPSPQTNKIL